MMGNIFSISDSHLCNMAFMLLILLLVTQGSQSTSQNISLGSSLTPDTNPAWLSSSGLFAFGFYQQDEGFKVGIWLATKPEITVVWTANRDDPPVSLNSTIELGRDGWLVLHTTDHGADGNFTSQKQPATSASMLDSGNFLLYDDGADPIWESFDYPCDTILGGQKLVTSYQLVSSVSASQSMSGNFGLEMGTDGYLVAFALNSPRGFSDLYWYTGAYEQDGDMPMSLNLNDTGSLYMVKDGVTYMVLNPLSGLGSTKNNTIVIFRATLNWDGNFVLYSHRFTLSTPSTNLTSSVTTTEWKALQDPCVARSVCGPNSYCDSISAAKFECKCFPGFLSLNETRNGRFHGCYRNFSDEEACSQKGLKLSYKYNITSLQNVKVGGRYSYSVTNLSKEACRQACLDDCNCWASLHMNVSCRMLKVPIIYAVHNRSILSTLFIKVSFPYNPVEDPVPASKKVDVVARDTEKLFHILAITLGCLAFMCTVMAFFSFFFYKARAHSFQIISQTTDLEVFRDHFTLRAFSFDELEKATDGFKEVIGRNSYGEVYKGFISEGNKAVAVKRLEGMFEGEGWFRAEITAIAQTHHRNLVGLLGFCIRGATKLLVYEFMSNGSLADLLFNTETQPGWNERVRVSLDVARGILYLHEECEARIIHCNITPHNILFDEFWTAKISDFGLSKLLRSNQSGTLLTGDRGTRGYLAPEWHKNTLISTKVDIYGFGVVLLEILCCSCRKDMEIDILSTWVYDCFVDKDWKRLIEDEEVDVHMLEKMVKVVLLCIQDDPDARPSIKNVILMLEGTTDIPIPPSPTPLI